MEGEEEDVLDENEEKEGEEEDDKDGEKICSGDYIVSEFGPP